jgi:phage shock protein PspC (stress-responsive transcriptional regulator)
MIGGVCAGFAEYFRIDPTLVRIAFVILAFAGGWGIIAYIIGLIIIPENSEKRDEPVESEQSGTKGAGYVWGVVLIMAGLILLLFNYEMLPWQLWRFWNVPWKLFWPLLIVVIGVLLLLSRSQGKTDGDESEVHSESRKRRRLTRSKRERMIGGVCGGIALYFRLDPAIIRFLWAIATIVSHGLGVVAYIVLLIVVPEEKVRTEGQEKLNGV